MSFAKLVVFDRRLAGAVLPGEAGRLIGEREVAALTEAAYRKGVDDARAVADHQLVELRVDAQQLSEGILRTLSGLEDGLLGQLRAALPGLAMEIARRLFAGFEPSSEVIERLCRESLEQLVPETDGLELTLSPKDAEVITGLSADWKRKYTGLRILSDPALARGDCMVRSRFGLVDARMSTKFEALERSLTCA